MSNDPSKEGEVLATLEGELTAPPRGPWLLGLMAITGLLVVLEGGRAVGQLVLALHHPAVVRLTGTTIEVRGSTRLLGRVLREHITIIPREALIHATREVRYPRLGLYAGLIALTIGSYVGVGLAVDGVRAGSPSMLGTGLLIVFVGLALDFAFSSLLPGLRGRARLLLVPRRGPVVSLATVEPGAADRFLTELGRGTPSLSGTARSLAPGSGTDSIASEAERETAEQA